MELHVFARILPIFLRTFLSVISVFISVGISSGISAGISAGGSARQMIWTAWGSCREYFCLKLYIYVR